MSREVHVRFCESRGVRFPPATHLEEDLAEQGYRSASDHLYVMAQLSRWLGSEQLDAADLSASGIEKFLHWRRVAGYVSPLSFLRMSRLVDHLVSIGVVPRFEPEVADTPVELLLERYRRYLVEERGLAASSIRNYAEVARDFLSHLSMEAEFNLEALTAAEVTEFVLSECRRCKVGSAKSMTTRLRSLLRFFYVVGLTSNELAGAVPSVASWRLASLPKAIAPCDVVRMLRSCDRRRVTGRRDFAVVTILSRLGLRAGEVAALQLDSIDWRNGEVVVRGKGSREDRLPLPVDVGEAVVGWLRRGREQCVDQSLFTRVRAPQQGLSSGGVSAIVRRACERARLPLAGAHRLRHSAATGMLRAGGSLAEVGQVLRHQRAGTTSIYAKVDRRSLFAVVRPLARRCGMSGLRQRREEYLAVRRALGYKLVGEAQLLAGFVAFAEEAGALVVTTDLAVAWTRTARSGSPVYLARRMRAVRSFARYLHSLDPATEIPPVDLFPSRKYRPTPYLYSDDEVAALMAAARELAQPLRAATFETLIGLLAATGLRISEAMRLDRDDLDVANGLLTVRDSKYGKSREVLLHPSAVEVLTGYLGQRDRLSPCPSAPSLFVSMRGTRLLHATVQPTFRGLVRRVGLEPRSPSCRPRIHSFRHSFAVNTLIGWYRDGGDVAARLPLLSTYMGHVDPAATYWYLSAAPELLGLAAERLELAAGGRP